MFLRHDITAQFGWDQGWDQINLEEAKLFRRETYRTKLSQLAILMYWLIDIDYT